MTFARLLLAHVAAFGILTAMTADAPATVEQVLRDQLARYGVNTKSGLARWQHEDLQDYFAQCFGQDDVVPSLRTLGREYLEEENIEPIPFQSVVAFDECSTWELPMKKFWEECAMHGALELASRFYNEGPLHIKQRSADYWYEFDGVEVWNEGDGPIVRMHWIVWLRQ